MLYKGTDTYSTVNMTVVALMTLLDQRVVELIVEYVGKLPVIHWETVYSSIGPNTTSRTGGIQRAAMCFFERERKLG